VRLNATLIKVAVFILVLGLIFPALLPGRFAVANAILGVDVWTDRGGQGNNAPGGTYQVGEQPTLLVQASLPCEAMLTFISPSGMQSSVILLLPAEPVSRRLGVAEQADIGMWQVIVEAQVPGQVASDMTSFTVVGPLSPTPQPAPAPQPEPTPVPLPVSPSPETGEGSEITIDVEGSTELMALTALKMAEGVLPANPEMDVNNDGQVTIDDVRLILQWAVKGPGTQPLQPAGQDDQMETQKPDAADVQALTGKWQMTRQSIQPAFPDSIPEFVINLIIPENSTWVIERAGNDLTIKYDSRDTWYKKTFLGKGITEGTTAALIGNQGASCVFQTQVKFYWKSFPFPIGIIVRDIKEIQGSFMDSVNVSVSGNDIQATVTTDNIQGTYLQTHKDGREVNKQIHYNVKIVYKGTRK